MGEQFDLILSIFLREEAMYSGFLPALRDFQRKKSKVVILISSHT